MSDQTAAQAWVAFGSALLGALVGGGASTLGSYLVAWRERVRTTRARIYDELQPRLQDRKWDDTVEGFVQAVAPLHRAAVIAGHRELRLAGEVIAAEVKFLAARTQRAASGTLNEETGEIEHGVDDAAFAAVEDACTNAHTALRTHLERKLEGPRPTRRLHQLRRSAVRRALSLRLNLGPMCWRAP